MTLRGGPGPVRPTDILCPERNSDFSNEKFGRLGNRPYLGGVSSLPVSFLVWIVLTLLLVSCASEQAGFPGKTGVASKTDFRQGAIQVFQTKPRGENLRPLVFVHGSPGKAEHWKRYFDDDELAKQFRMIAYDRPGYGKSTGGFVDFGGQMEALEKLLGQQKAPVTLVGHSLGGPIVLAAAARYPEKVHKVVVLAPSVDPTPGLVFKMNRFLGCIGLGRLMLPPWRVSHLEVLALNPSLQSLPPELGRITSPVTIVQGGRDQLVPSTNVGYLKKYLTATNPKVIFLENEGHFIPWTKFELVKRVLSGEASPGGKVVKIEK